MCGCYEWESTGLPCVHAGMVILHMQLKIDDYCDEFYSVKKYMDIYKEMIQPLPDFTDLSYTHRTGMLQPPELKRRPGRSKKSRKIVFDEPPASEFRKRSSSVRCAICGKTCHNKRTYSRDPDTGKQVSTKKAKGWSSRGRYLQLTKNDKVTDICNRYTRYYTTKNNSTFVSHVHEEESGKGKSSFQMLLTNEGPYLYVFMQNSLSVMFCCG
ncbi:uncharacterized protein LOC122071656 isoform X1 [Macadamia integrifolia]|uniref:uncharacterized protein LOC122071656 isoform X1 n=1 Tax=Macadamia integrifolia TaxID=60698 RepID=UPI001C4E7214|nr:uncharacterized protein LOC122071656 isoform X1 [Macadamia integrifolia]